MVVDLNDNEIREMRGALLPEDTIQDRVRYLKVLRGGLAEELERAKHSRLLCQALTRQEQVRDLAKLEKLKKWARKNPAGLSVVVIAIAGIITTVEVGARKAVLLGARATSKFCQSRTKSCKKKCGQWSRKF